ncbi:serpin family protein [Prolixibacteraceae bacterium JC049]|nr:serpin family protein [Prolixibacteraceae bacterium JC049]
MKMKLFLLVFCVCFIGIENGRAQSKGQCEALNSYSFELYHRLNSKKENLFISPVSTYYAMMMFYEGAKGKTKQEFEKVLHINSLKQAEKDYLLHLVRNRDNSANMNVFNAIWLHQPFWINADYKKRVGTKYATAISQADFNNSDDVACTINNWVADKTNNRITRIVKGENISPQMPLLLANAVYFKAEWAKKFKKKYTQPGIFFVNSSLQQETPFMSQTEHLDYFENDQFQFVSKSYKNSELIFCVLLPKKLFELESIEKQMNPHFLNEIFDNCKSEEIKLFLPKIKMKESYRLNGALSSLGLKSAFSSNANFKGLSSESSLWLGQVVHKTWLEIDEEKTEAAAATSTFYIRGLPRYKIVKSDHPFVFFVVNKKSRAILFMGRYAQPTSGKIITDSSTLSENVKERKNLKISPNLGYKNPLIFIDGKKASPEELKNMNPDDIDGFEIVKDTEKLKKYNALEHGGVILVRLKKEKE